MMATPRESKVRRRSDFVLAAASLCVFAVAALLTNLDKALAFSVAFMVFLAIVQTKRESWSDTRFWAILTVLAIIHIVVLSLVHIPELRFGLISLPFALVDGFALWGFLNWIERTRCPIMGKQGYARRSDPMGVSPEGSGNRDRVMLTP